MLSPKSMINEYFNIQNSNANYSLIDDLNFENEPNNQFSEIKQSSKSRKQILLRKQEFLKKKSKSKISVKPKLSSKNKESPFKEAESLYIPFIKLSRLEELNQMKHHSKSSRINIERANYMPKNIQEQRNKVDDEYYVKEKIEDTSKPVFTQIKPPLPIKIKRSLSEMKPSRLQVQKQQSPNSKSKYKSKVKQFHLPIIKTTQNMIRKQFPKNSLGIELSNLSSHQQPSVIHSNRIQSSRNRKYSLLKKSKSIKPLKIYNKVNSLKLKTQQTKYNTNQIEEQLDVLNLTLTQMRALNEIQNKTNRLFTQRLNYSSLLLNIQYHNMLKEIQRNKNISDKN